jgi:hypothetical protein
MAKNFAVAFCACDDGRGPDDFAAHYGMVESAKGKAPEQIAPVKAEVGIPLSAGKLADVLEQLAAEHPQPPALAAAPLERPLTGNYYLPENGVGTAATLPSITIFPPVFFGGKLHYI